MPARIPMMTMTIKSSTRVKPCSTMFLWSSLDRSWIDTWVVPLGSFGVRRPATGLNGRFAVILNRSHGPFSTRHRSSWRMSLRVKAARLVEDSIHRGDQGDGDEADDHTHQDDHRGLEERRGLFEFVGKLADVILSRVVELLVERACIFANAHHLRRRLREQLSIRDRHRESFAFEHALSSADKCGLEHFVVCSLNCRRERVGKRHARL